MYFNLIFDNPEEEVSELVTEAILSLYEKYKDNEEIFPKEDKENDLPGSN